MGLVRVSVDKTLSNERTALVDGLNTLWGHIVSIREFEYLFLVINDLESSIVQPLSHVTGVEPAILVHHSSSQLRVTIVSEENIGAFNAKYD